ncbi:hypothetical protein BGX38DRAFT_1276993 [Terfezia claveryi]|nr:hypothetical protein BGX38DRAFT_1276993 [Terfezia claveryi]
MPSYTACNGHSVLTRPGRRPGGLKPGLGAKAGPGYSGRPGHSPGYSGRPGHSPGYSGRPGHSPGYSGRPGHSPGYAGYSGRVQAIQAIQAIVQAIQAMVQAIQAVVQAIQAAVQAMQDSRLRELAYNCRCFRCYRVNPHEGNCLVTYRDMDNFDTSSMDMSGIFNDDQETISDLSQLSSSQFTNFDPEPSAIPSSQQSPSAIDISGGDDSSGAAPSSLWHMRNTPRRSWIWAAKRYADGSTKHPIQHLQGYRMTENGPAEPLTGPSIIQQPVRYTQGPTYRNKYEDRRI